MKQLSIILFLLIIFFVSGECFAEETAGYIVLLQGENSTHVESTNGSTLIIEDMNPFAAYIETKGHLGSVKDAIKIMDKSLDAAILITDDSNETTSLVTVSHPVYSEDERKLTLETKPLEFYEGTLLKHFADEATNQTIKDPGVIKLTRVFVEIHEKAPENGLDSPAPYTNNPNADPTSIRGLV